jgi:mercuric ion transport protein
MDELEAMVDRRAARVRRVSLIGAIVAAVAASACCLVPAIFAIVGISGVGFAVALEPYRPVFLGLTAIALGIGFYVTYRTRPVTAGIACDCERPRPRVAGAARAILWSSTVAAVLLAVYPSLAAIGARTEATGTTPIAGSVTRTIRIDGSARRRLARDRGGRGGGGDRLHDGAVHR